MAAREKPKPFTTFGIDIGTETKFVQVPTAIKDVFADEAQMPEGNETASTTNIANVLLLHWSLRSLDRDHHACRQLCRLVQAMNDKPTDHRLNAHSQSVIHWKIAAYKLT